MAKRKPNKQRRKLSKEEQRLRAIYAKSLREFSAADLQKYTVIEKGIPMEKVMKELEQIQKTYKPTKPAHTGKILTNRDAKHVTKGSKTMAKRKPEKARKRPLSKEERRIKAIYAKSRREFSAADLQKFTVIEKGIPIEKVLAEVEARHREYLRKSK